MRRTPTRFFHAAAAVGAAAAILTLSAPPVPGHRAAPLVVLEPTVPPSTSTSTTSTPTTSTSTSTTVPATTSTTRATSVAVSRSEARPAEPTPDQPTGSEEGGASWYAYLEGTCAHKTLPKGTVLTVVVTDGPYAGRSTTCRVADRGPYIAGRIVDLDQRVFERLAPTSTGVLPVRITW